MSQTFCLLYHLQLLKNLQTYNYHFLQDQNNPSFSGLLPLNEKYRSSEISTLGGIFVTQDLDNQRHLASSMINTIKLSWVEAKRTYIHSDQI